MDPNFGPDVTELSSPPNTRDSPPEGDDQSEESPQRFAAALFAIAPRFAGDDFAARALPPFRPPSFSRATAAGFFSSLALDGSASGAMASSTARAS